MSEERKYALDEVYPGTRSFSEEWHDRFFGRFAEVADLTALICTYDVVSLYGESGTGKSSLIQAGLGPELGELQCVVGRVSGPAPDDKSPPQNIFAFHLLTSLGVPAKDLASATLARTLPGFLEDLPAWIGAAKSAKMREEVKPPDNLSKDRFVFIDQFEEILTTRPDRWKDREGFFKELREVLKAAPHVHFILAAREEHLAALERYDDLLSGASRSRYHLERLTVGQAKEAILKPARLAGYTPDEKLVSKVVYELLRSKVEIEGEPIDVSGEFVEPLHLQIMCLELAKSKFQPDSALSGISNDVNAALMRYYDRALKNVAGRVPFRELRLRRFISRNLLTSAKTRGLVYSAKAKGLFGGVNLEMLKALESEKILREEQRAGASWYELTHDRFIEPILQSNSGAFQRLHWFGALVLLLVTLSSLGVTLNRRIVALQSQASKDRTDEHKLSQRLKRTRDALDATAVFNPVAALAFWKDGDYGNAWRLFKIGRENAPLQSIEVIDGELAKAEMLGDAKNIAALKTARTEFLRYPVIQQEMANQPDLRDYLCQHNFSVIGMSGPNKKNLEDAARGVRNKYPNADVFPPPQGTSNPSFSLVYDLYLDCAGAQALALRLFQEDKLRAMITPSYCSTSCRPPDYDHPVSAKEVRMPDARVGTPYFALIPILPGAALVLQTGTLPPGLEVSNTAISGTPTQAGTSPFTFEVSQPGGAPLRLSLRVVPSL